MQQKYLVYSSEIVAFINNRFTVKFTYNEVVGAIELICYMREFVILKQQGIGGYSLFARLLLSSKQYAQFCSLKIFLKMLEIYAKYSF